MSANPKDWTPHPDDWFDAVVTYRNFRNHTLHFGLSDGSGVICVCRNVTRSLEGHTLCAPEGTVAAVRIEPHQPRHVSYHMPKYRAIECQFLSDNPIPRTKEKVVISSWAEGRTIGSGIRACACPIFVTTGGRHGSNELLQEGDEVQVSIEASELKPGLAAARVISSIGRSTSFSDDEEYETHRCA